MFILNIPLLLAILHNPLFNSFTDVTNIIIEFDFFLSNEYLDNKVKFFHKISHERNDTIHA